MDQRFHTSQYTQCQIIEQLCYPNDEIHAGIFMEIGGWDGIDISNTYWLEKVKNWNGLLIEPIKDKAEWAKHNRWNTVWQGCIYDKDGTVDFHHINGYSEMLSGIREAMSDSHKERIDRETSQHGLSTDIENIQCKTINSILDSYNIKQIDVMSLDVQTAELKVLNAYNVEKNPCKLIILDMNNSNNDLLKEWFEKNNYKLYWSHENADEYIYFSHTL
jgi:FkbM family methyltransferase